MNPEILYRDQWLVAINKPAGLLSEPDLHGSANAYDLLVKSLQPGFLGQIHRLDKLTSGVLLFALKKDALKKMNALQEQKQLRKTYLAITTGLPILPTEGILHSWLKKDQQRFMALLSDQPKAGFVPIETAYHWSPFSSNFVFWKLNIHGGKYHQLRAQLAHLGCPIVGDGKYQSPLPDPNRIALHAQTLEFIHPYTEQPIRIDAEQPDCPPWNIKPTGSSE